MKLTVSVHNYDDDWAFWTKSGVKVLEGHTLSTSGSTAAEAFYALMREVQVGDYYGPQVQYRHAEHVKVVLDQLGFLLRGGGSSYEDFEDLSMVYHSLPEGFSLTLSGNWNVVFTFLEE